LAVGLTLQAAPARSHVPASQRERLALLEKLEQIPLKVRCPLLPP